MGYRGTWCKDGVQALSEYQTWTDNLHNAIGADLAAPSRLYDGMDRDERRRALDTGQWNYSGKLTWAAYFGAALAGRPDLALSTRLIEPERESYWGARAAYEAAAPGFVAEETWLGEYDVTVLQEIADRDGTTVAELVRRRNRSLGDWLRERRAEVEQFWADNPECGPRERETATCARCGEEFNCLEDGDAGGDEDLCGRHSHPHEDHSDTRVCQGIGCPYGDQDIR